MARLFSLNLSTDGDFLEEDLGQIYRLIFSLPVLKHITLFSRALHPAISLGLNTDNRYSTIECMTIGHSCYLDRLMTLLSYTPRLCRLICEKFLESISDVQKSISITLPNLRYISIPECYLEFDEFEPFIMQICSELRIMRLITDSDSAYLDANRWERLISHHMPNLRKFHFTHYEFLFNHLHIAKYHKFMHRFMSPFWIERQWIFELKATRNWESETELTYSICPNK